MIRITAGLWKGRPLAIPKTPSTRPSHALLRQALFNTIQSEVIDAVVLDLFSGSGALGFEALSRGAEKVVFVENHPQAVKAIRQNIETLGARDRAEVLALDVPKALQWLESKQKNFDLIFADPPYRKGLALQTLEWIDTSALLVTGGLFILEWQEEAPLKERYTHLVRVREKTYGEGILSSFLKEG